MKFIFYCIYNTQYLDGKNKASKSPWFEALTLTIGGSLAWIAIITEIIYFYLLNRNFPSLSIVGVLLLCTCTAYVHYIYLIKDKRYQKIYEQYKTDDKDRKKTEKLICVCYVFSPILLSLLIAMIWHNAF